MSLAEHPRHLHNGAGLGTTRARLAFAVLACLALLAARPGSTAAEPEAVAAAMSAATTGAGATPEATATAPAVAPADLHDLDAWIRYRTRSQVPMLPAEARIFYRRGLIAWKAGQDAEAVRLLRGAGTLDPTFLSPHAALAAWFSTREPSAALQECAATLALLRHDFLLQLDMVGNAVFFLFTLGFLGLTGAALLTVATHQDSLRHMFQERFARRLTPATARLWSWLVLVVPFVLGLGLAAPALLLLGVLWPVLRFRERLLTALLTIAVALASFAPGLMGRLTLPLRSDVEPFFTVASLENQPWTPERQKLLASLAASTPDDPFLSFGLGWIARRGEDLVTAEAAYRRVLTQWPGDDRALVNLGNILAVQGRFDEALALYDRALKLDPGNAAAWFNQSQVFTRLFDFRRATESVSRASALDFELVQRLQSASVGGALPLADQWIEPATFWKALRSPEAQHAVEPATPPLWRNAIEVSSPLFGLLAFALAVTGIVLGFGWQRSLPLRTCSNCGIVVCRRCAERRREVALCPACAMVEARAESADFGRVLLGQQRRRIERQRSSVRTAVASLVPGFGHAWFHDVFGAAAVLGMVAWLVMVGIGVSPPFDARHDFGLAGPGLPPVILLTLWVVVYGFSILRYVTRQAKLDAQTDAAPIRSRASQATHRAEAA